MKTTALVMIFVLAVGACGPRAVKREPGPAAPDSITTRLVVDGREAPSVDDVRRGGEVHGALAQLHRWFLFYDNDLARLQDQLDVLAAEATFQNPDGRFSARENYVQRAASIPRGWGNAHFVQTVRVGYADDKRLRVDADVIYLNRGALEDGKVHSNTLDYNVLTVDHEGPLPLIEEIKISSALGGLTPEFRTAYAENRLKSITHLWLAALETRTPEASDFASIFDNVFTLNLSGKRLTSVDELVDWLNSSDYPKVAMHHRIRSFKFTELVANEFEIEIDLDRYFVMDGKVDKVMVRQNILVKDKPGETFAHVTLITERDEATIKADEATGDFSRVTN